MKAPLRELADLCLGKMLDKAKNKGELKPYLRNINVRWGTFDLEDVQEMRFEPHELERYTVIAGDVVMCEGGEPGRCAVWKRPERFYLQKALHRIRCNAALDPSFLAYQVQLLAANGDLARRFTGSTIKHLPGRVLAAVPIQVAPAPEQHRIVAEIEKQFTRLDAAVANLERVKANLKRARASVLKAAVEGRLVPTEASLAQAEGRDYEPASVLLERILEERERKHEEAQEGAKRKKKYKPPVEPDTEGLPELPDGWVWSSVDQLCAEVTDGDHQPPPTSDEGVPFLVIGNVRTGRLNFEGCRRVTDSYYDELAWKRRPDSNDLLYTVVGSFGIPVRVPDDRQFCVQRHIAILKAPQQGTKDYLLHAMASQRFYQAASKKATGTAQKTVGLKSLRGLAVPLPPAAEQGRVVVEIERRLSVVEAVEGAVALNLARCNRLRQSILKRAFEGKLVTQGPGDEPASELLARVQAEAEAAKPKRTKKTSTRKKAAKKKATRKKTTTA